MKINRNSTKILVIIFLLSGGFYSHSFAADIDSTQALSYAEFFFTQKGWCESVDCKKMELVFSPVFNDSVRGVQDYAYFVYQIDQKGYVAISAWNFSRRILFYAEGDFESNSKVDAFQYWINFYIMLMLEKYDDISTTTKGTVAEFREDEIYFNQDATFVDPLLSSTWSQGCYFNELCPADIAGPCNHVWTGCVAVAMAQIMNYHQYPSVGVGSNTYTLPVYGELFAGFSEGYDYSLYPASLSSSNPDLARFMYHCGVALNMKYGPYGSGASSLSVDNALINYFKYTKALKFQYMDDFSIEYWKDLIKEDLKKGNPVYYSGVSEEGIGHAFVCDGFDEFGLFHFNLGWGGAADGYYAIEDLAYNNSQGAIFNIEPMYEGPANVQDSLALVSLYNSTDGANWINNENWLTGKCADWFGISLQESGVSIISLNDNNLIGQIPQELWTMDNLVTLDLSENQIEGEIPIEIGGLKNLNILYLSDNQISGTIPMEIGALTNLWELELSDNQLNGSIPSDIGNLVNLQFLALSDNQLSGKIPEEIVNLVNLQYLYMQYNKLSGSIPVEIGNLVNLKYLHLSNNQITGNIPEEIGNLVNLGYLYLGMNQLSGSVPGEIGNLVNLRTLHLDNNKIEELPALLSLSNLDRLTVYDNQLTFEDIEPNIGIATDYFNYSPQSSIGEEEYLDIIVGGNRTLSVTCGGENNLYQWFKNGVGITGASAEEFLLSNITFEDVGEYVCRITNTIATALTLYSNPIHIYVLQAELNVYPTTATVNSESGTSMHTVTSNIDWSVSESSDWLIATKTNATTLTISYDKNTKVDTRSAEVTLSGNGVVSQTVSINQEGALVDAIVDVLGNKKFTIYPNPSSNKLYLKSDLDINDELLISLYDHTGKLLYLSKINRMLANENIEIDVSGFEFGVYILKLNDLKSINLMKIIIQ